MHRSLDPEILDGAGIPADVAARAYRGLRLTHRLLGNTAVLIRAIRRDPLPVRRVLDVGCGHGGVLVDVARRLRVDVIGVDLKPTAPGAVPFPIMQADAVRDPLPRADVAISLCLAHHLDEEELIGMVRNVGRSCRRFVLLDLVRHRLPLVLFRAAAPLFIPRMNVADGCQSIRRSYTPAELRSVIQRALEGTAARFRHTVAPCSIRQIADISY